MLITMGRFRFYRFRNGLASFAEVELRIDEKGDGILWAPHLAKLERVYGEVVAEAISQVLSWNDSLKAVTTQVDDLVELTGDTRPDAVKCAAVAAAWTALGGHQDGIEFNFENGLWIASRIR